MATARQQLLLLPPLPLPLCFVCNVQQQQATMFCSFHWKKRAERGSRLVSRSDCDSACLSSLPACPSALSGRCCDLGLAAKVFCCCCLSIHLISARCRRRDVRRHPIGTLHAPLPLPLLLLPLLLLLPCLTLLLPLKIGCVCVGLTYVL